MHLVRTQILPKTNIYYPQIRICTRADRWLRNASFSETFAYVLNEYPAV